MTTLNTELYPKGTEEISTWYPTEMKEEELYKPGTKPGFDPIFMTKVSRSKDGLNEIKIKLVFVMEFDC